MSYTMKVAKALYAITLICDSLLVRDFFTANFRNSPKNKQANF